MINELEEYKSKIMLAMQIDNYREKKYYDLNLVNKIDYCNTIDELNELLETKEFKKIQKIMDELDAK